MLRRFSTILATSACVATIATAAPTAAHAQVGTYDIRAGSLRSALDAWARQSRRQVIYRIDEVRGARSPGARGALSAEAALEAVLARSGFAARSDASGAVAIVRNGVASPLSGETQAGGAAADSGSADADIVITGTLIRGVVPSGANLITADTTDVQRSGASTVQGLFRTIPQQFSGGPSEQSDVRSGAGQRNPARGASIDLRGLGSDATLTLVNGRRLAPSGDGSFVNVSAIPLAVVERVEILADGASATYGSDAIAGVVNIILRQSEDGVRARIYHALPTQGGAAETVASGTFGTRWQDGSVLIGVQYRHQDNLAAQQRRFTRSCDLRDLGGGNFCTLSASPGNIIAPANLAGAIPTGQDGRTLSASQILRGQTNAINSNWNFDLLARRRQLSFFVSSRQELGQGVDLFFDGFATDQDVRSTAGASTALLTVPATNAFRQLNRLGLPGTTPIGIQYSFINDLGNTEVDAQGRTYSATAGLNADLSDSWRAELYGVFGQDKSSTLSSGSLDTRSAALGGGLQLALASSDPATAFNPFGDGGDNSPAVLAAISSSSASRTNLRFASANLKLDGDLFSLGAGPVKLAAGVEFRREWFDFRSETLVSGGTIPAPTIMSGQRNIKAVFGELFIPLFDRSNEVPGLRFLDVSASARIDNYSDFGSTVNPKIGARWSPLRGLTFRGSYGTSFKAPRLNDLLRPRTVQYLGATTAFGGIDRNGDRILNLVLISGGSPDLEAENGRSYTLGVDLRPAFLPGFSASATYFNVKIRNRIGAVSDLRAILSNPSAYEDVIYFPTPTDTFAAEQIGNPAVVFGVPFPPGEIEGLINTALVNIARVQMEGVDFDARYRTDIGRGALEASLRASYILDFTNQQALGLPPLVSVDVVGRPVDFRARAGISWLEGPIETSIFANYVGSYSNTAVSPVVPISSSTTFDVQLAYRADEGPLAGTRFSVTALNVFDKDPPFVNGGNYAFDGTNFSAIGRVIALEVSTRF